MTIKNETKVEVSKEENEKLAKGVDFLIDSYLGSSSEESEEESVEKAAKMEKEKMAKKSKEDKESKDGRPKQMRKDQVPEKQGTGRSETGSYERVQTKSGKASEMSNISKSEEFLISREEKDVLDAALAANRKAEIDEKEKERQKLFKSQVAEEVAKQVKEALKGVKEEPIAKSVAEAPKEDSEIKKASDKIDALSTLVGKMANQPLDRKAITTAGDLIKSEGSKRDGEEFFTKEDKIQAAERILARGDAPPGFNENIVFELNSSETLVNLNHQEVLTEELLNPRKV